ncbi:MAG: hypothetical protein CHKLHMKO_00619 [Candidatus Argoarchaeum ethanivorans]|uniref:SpoVT-AbrB domain-containing protein n=1 Tax=Candidatus Argoarchaeum ethanivorans TaxID=2608793 RepID=A0A811THX7_9EURY|nr:MAG: hypothetical protein CHKLHMKO_00619 [Candidatus Argoarchaeum ethanivorans]
MIDVAITKLRSKGQIVIPSEMRDNFREGEKIVIIKSEERLILKKVSDFGKNFEEDLAFAKKNGRSMAEL